MGSRTPKEIWEAALGELQIQVSKPNYRTWFEKTIGISYQENQFIVGVHNSFVGEYLDKNQRSLIEKALYSLPQDAYVTASAEGCVDGSSDQDLGAVEIRVAQVEDPQIDLLTTAAGHVAPGGRLVYATCSVLAEENDAVADAFSVVHPEFEARAVLQDILHDDAPGRLQLWPHVHGTDGFFIATWRRR